eukprot:Em0001g709a
MDSTSRRDKSPEDKSRSSFTPQVRGAVRRFINEVDQEEREPINNYDTTLRKAVAPLLDKAANYKKCHLVMAGGRVSNLPLLSKQRPWSLGGFMEELGGFEKGKRLVIGVYVPNDDTTITDHSDKDILISPPCARKSQHVTQQLTTTSTFVHMKNQVTSSDLHVFVCDLGVAKLQSKIAIHKTSRGPGAGTVAYKAPEMFRDSRRSTLVDIYSFGCVIIELFTGKRVRGELDTCQITCKILGTREDDPQTPSCEEVPEEHREICAHSTALDGSDRPSAQEMILSYNDVCISGNEIKSIDDKQQKQNEWERKDKHQHDDDI